MGSIYLHAILILLLNGAFAPGKLHAATFCDLATELHRVLTEAKNTASGRLCTQGACDELIISIFNQAELAALSGKNDYSAAYNLVRNTTAFISKRRSYDDNDRAAYVDPTLQTSAIEMAREITPYIRSHFNQVLNEEGLSPAQAQKLIESGNASRSLLNRLREPFTQTGKQSLGHTKLNWSEPLVKRLLEEKIADIVHNQAEKKLKIVLGGTMSEETKIVAELVDKVLNENQSLASNAADWTIEIVGYSIETRYLMNASKEISALPPYVQKWIRFEYIDLLNKQQLKRLRAERPDFLFAASSLYVANYYTQLKKAIEAGAKQKTIDDLRKIIESLDVFVDEAPLAVRPGGAIIVEGPFSEVVPFKGFTPVKSSDGLYTGVYLKQSATEQPSK